MSGDLQKAESIVFYKKPSYRNTLKETEEEK